MPKFPQPTLRCDDYGCKHPARFSVASIDNGVVRPEWRPMCGVHVRSYSGRSWWQVGPIEPAAYATRLAAQVEADAAEARAAEERRAAQRAKAEEQRLRRIAQAEEAEAAEWMWEREERVPYEGEQPIVYYHVVRVGHPRSSFTSVRIDNEPGMPPSVSWAGGSWPAAAAVVYAEAIAAAVAEARGRAASAE